MLSERQKRFSRLLASQFAWMVAQGMDWTVGDAWRSTDVLMCPDCGGDVTYQELLVYNGSATSITDFDDGENGQEVTLWFNDGNTTLVNGANLLMNGAANKTGTANDVLRIVRRASKWYQAGTLQAN